MINLLFNKLEKMLPSGSGINTNYEFTLLKNSKIQIKNSYHCMHENSYYDGYQDFYIVFDLVSNGWQLYFSNGNYLERKYMLRGFLEDLFAEHLNF